MTPALFAAGMVALCAALCVGAVRAWRAVEARPLRPLEAWVGRLAAVAVMALPLLADAGALPGPRSPSVGLPLTGGTVTGQVVFSGVATDITTATNEDLTIAPSGTGKLAVNGGGAAPAIEVTTTATNNTAEIYERWSTSDETNTKCALLNGSATNSGVNPTFACHSDEGSGWNALTIMGSVAAAADTGTGAAIRLYTSRGTAPGTPSAALTTIPSLELYNYTTLILSVDNAGNIKLPSGATKSRGTITLSAGSGSATVASGSICVCTDTTAANAVRCSVTTTTLNAVGTGTDVIAYHCM